MSKRTLIASVIAISILCLPPMALAGSSVAKLKVQAATEEEYGAIYEEVLAEGPSAVPALLALLEGTDPAPVKITALRILGEMKAQEALDPLAKILETSKDPGLIVKTGRTMGNIGGNHAAELLMDALEGARAKRQADGASARKAAVLGLGLANDPRAVLPLMAELSDTNHDELTRIYAAGSLGLLGKSDGLQLATAGLNWRDPSVRLAAVQALGLIGALDSATALAGLTGAGNPYAVRVAAALSLVQIKAAQLTGAEKADFIKNVLLNNPRTPDFVTWGTRILARMGTQEAVDTLKELAAREGDEFSALRRAARIKLRK